MKTAGVICFIIFCVMLWGYIKHIQYKMKDVEDEDKNPL